MSLLNKKRRGTRQASVKQSNVKNKKKLLNLI